MSASLLQDRALGPGVRLGKYTLLRKLAIGGMAELFLSRAEGIEGFEKNVVLKRILPQLAASEDFVRMFLDEARLAGTLHHPNIAQVYDIGRAGRSYFFTMEYVRGKDLREILRASKKRGELIPFNHAISMVMGCCAGLHYAHEKLGSDGQPLGVVHRDVSPANILVTYEGGVKIVDFGVAKARSRQTETRAGSLKGKISYMSPEQCKGELVDRRSDVFAIGILLFELTTSTRAFRGENEFAILSKIVNEDVPSPATRRASYPPELEAIVNKALRRNPDERYSTAEELQLDLEHFARKQSAPSSAIELAKFLRTLFADELNQPEAAAGSVQLGDGDGPIGDEDAIELLDADIPEVEISVGSESAEEELKRRRARWRVAAVAVGSSLITVLAVVCWFALHHPRATAAVPLATVAMPSQAVAAKPVSPPQIEPALPVIAVDAQAPIAPAQMIALPRSKHSRVVHHERSTTPPHATNVQPAWDPDSALPPGKR